jgi:DNA-binding transcriptional MerR regulator
MADGLTINEASETTGWSPRMLRYLETVGLIEPSRTSSGYRVFGPEQLQRLRTLKELLERFGFGLSDVAFAKRLREERELGEALDAWFEAPVTRPQGMSSADWLRWEQEKHQRLLALADAA